MTARKKMKPVRLMCGQICVAAIGKTFGDGLFWCGWYRDATVISRGDEDDRQDR